MLPLHVFSSRQFSAANAVTFVVYGALGGTLFLLPDRPAGGRRVQPAGVRGRPAAGDRHHAGPVGAVGRAGGEDRAAPADVGRPARDRGRAAACSRGSPATGGYLTDVLPAVLVFGFGLAINVAPLTSTAMSAVPAEHAGVASAVNNDVARAAGLIAVAVLPVAAGITGNSYLHPAELSDGFRNAVLISAAACAAGGLLAALTIRNPPRARPRPGVPERPGRAGLHCALDAPPLRGNAEPAASGQGPAAGAAPR